MKFRFEDYKGNYAMNCRTEEEAKEFCKLMHENGLKWNSDESYLDKSSWERYKEDTCYCFNYGLFSSTDYYLENGFSILNWSDFRNDTVGVNKFTKSDLEIGMVVETRNRYKYLVCQGNRIVREVGWSDLTYYDEQLMNGTDKSFDIMKAYKKTNAVKLSDIFNVSDKHLVWERKEAKQFTNKELLFLKEFTDGYEWIAKDKGGEVYLYKEKPCRNTNDWWDEGGNGYTRLPNTLSFDCLSWEDEEPTRIDEYVDRTK